MRHRISKTAIIPATLSWTCCLSVVLLSGCREPDPSAISELTAGMIQDEFEEHGFKLTGPEDRAGTLEWQCERKRGHRSFKVVVRGPHHKDVVNVEAVAEVPSGQDMRQEAMKFFEQAATFPFDAALEKTAREWIAGVYDTGGSTVIGGIGLRFQGVGLRQTLTLTRAQIPGQ